MDEKQQQFSALCCFEVHSNACREYFQETGQGPLGMSRSKLNQQNSAATFGRKQSGDEHCYLKRPYQNIQLNGRETKIIKLWRDLIAAMAVTGCFWSNFLKMNNVHYFASPLPNLLITCRSICSKERMSFSIFGHKINPAKINPALLKFLASPRHLKIWMAKTETSRKLFSCHLGIYEHPATTVFCLSHLWQDRRTQTVAPEGFTNKKKQLSSKWRQRKCCFWHRHDV